MGTNQKGYCSASFLKWTSLFVLTLQNSTQALAIRYSRVRDTKEIFFATTAVFLTEVVKLITCTILVFGQEMSVIRGIQRIWSVVVKDPMDTLKVCIPSIIYTLQNNLLYISISHLSATTFMVTYQLKILTTAIFSMLILRKAISRLQWFSLILLFAGVSVIQVEEQKMAKPTPEPDASVTPHAGHVPDHAAQNPLIGLGAALLAVVMSGFAGVYFEKVLKGSDVTVWLRNVQLSVLAIPVSLLTMFFKEGNEIREHGILYGYDSLVWFIVLLYALGGLTVAVVVKYADNIMKAFATSLAIVLSCAISVALFDFRPTTVFFFGLLLVFGALHLYFRPASPSKTVDDALEPGDGKTGLSNA